MKVRRVPSILGEDGAQLIIIVVIALVVVLVAVVVVVVIPIVILILILIVIIIGFETLMNRNRGVGCEGLKTLHIPTCISKLRQPPQPS